MSSGNPTNSTVLSSNTTVLSPQQSFSNTCPVGTTKFSTYASTCTACDPEQTTNAFPAGTLCPGGDGSAQEPRLCSAGSFCPDAATEISVPDNHYSRAGFVSAVKCSWWADCDAGADTMGIATVYMVCLLVFYLALLASVQYAVWKRKILHRLQGEHASEDKDWVADKVDLFLTKLGALNTLQHPGPSSGAVNGNKPRPGAQNRSGTAATEELQKEENGTISKMNKSKRGFQGFTEKFPPVTVEFHRVSLFLKSNHSKIVDDVSVSLPGRCVAAVMGPSGSGKTSLLNAITGRASVYADITGEIKIANQKDALKKFPNEIGFVPQDDVMLADLTVYENLYFQAQLRLPQEMSTFQKKAIVEDVLSVLEIQHIRNSIVGDNAESNKRGISGGQKKRVNIGLELVSYPRVLFLDEPTSGLDSTAALEVARCLAKLGELGITTICVIHQPRFSVFELFTHLVLLAPGGKLVYSGPTTAAQAAKLVASGGGGVVGGALTLNTNPSPTTSPRVVVGNNSGSANQHFSPISQTGGVREYFESLGFHVPAGENVADWIMDILSGSVVRAGPKLNVKRSGGKNAVMRTRGYMQFTSNKESSKLTGSSTAATPATTQELVAEWAARDSRKSSETTSGNAGSNLNGGASPRPPGVDKNASPRTSTASVVQLPSQNAATPRTAGATAAGAGALTAQMNNKLAPAPAKNKKLSAQERMEKRLTEFDEHLVKKIRKVLRDIELDFGVPADEMRSHLAAELLVLDVTAFQLLCSGLDLKLEKVKNGILKKGVGSIVQSRNRADREQEELQAVEQSLHIHRVEALMLNLGGKIADKDDVDWFENKLNLYHIDTGDVFLSVQMLLNRHGALAKMQAVSHSPRDGTTNSEFLSPRSSVSENAGADSNPTLSCAASRAGLQSRNAPGFLEQTEVLAKRSFAQFSPMQFFLKSGTATAVGFLIGAVSGTELSYRWFLTKLVALPATVYAILAAALSLEVFTSAEKRVFRREMRCYTGFVSCVPCLVGENKAGRNNTSGQSKGNKNKWNILNNTMNIRNALSKNVLFGGGGGNSSKSGNTTSDTSQTSKAIAPEGGAEIRPRSTSTSAASTTAALTSPAQKERGRPATSSVELSQAKPAVSSTANNRLTEYKTTLATYAGIPLGPFSYFLGKTLVDLFRVFTYPLAFMIPFLLLTRLEIPWLSAYLCFFLIHWMTSGFAQWLSLSLDDGQLATLLALVIPALLSTVFGGTMQGASLVDMEKSAERGSPVFLWISHLSGARWFNELFYIYQFEALPENINELPAVQMSHSAYGFDKDWEERKWVVIEVMVIQGFAWRALALLALYCVRYEISILQPFKSSWRCMYRVAKNRVRENFYKDELKMEDVYGTVNPLRGGLGVEIDITKIEKIREEARAQGNRENAK
ncbi:unnamed protein product [Amoebophrya sp. A120]|nr:unnamed protein product [Amoebophrya sp. A120]|eukprot:GSA120T00023349001.1